MGLPMVAACANISSARPAVDEQGVPLPLVLTDDAAGHPYWSEPDFALDNGVIAVIRDRADPFFFDEGRIGGWGEMSLDPQLEARLRRDTYGFSSAIIVPVRLPRSVIGAVVWASNARHDDIAGLFERRADSLLGMAVRLMLHCQDDARSLHAYRLTRREVQCLKLMSAGKTDGEIATIMDIARPTVRFHLKNAGAKLGEQGRLRIVQRAVSLGYIGID